jgi:hypothetical protein
MTSDSFHKKTNLSRWRQSSSVPYQTDERLKSYLDTNQMHREQMCLAVIAIDRRFSDVRPRHPRGGPDGARDIDATFNGGLRTFGAVGFINQATDSDADKKDARAKFMDDLTAALEQRPQPQVFVFFTNVNFTLHEKDTLAGVARQKGIAHAEVFDRERIRLSLDNPDGLSIRFQYLGIPLSEAEQATFFARWGDDIQNVIADGFGEVRKSLNRILFLQEAELPLVGLTAVLELDGEYSGGEIGHFRAFAWVHLKAPSHGLFSFIFGSTDNTARLKVSTAEGLTLGKSGISQSMCGGQWEMRIPENQLEGKEAENVDESADDYKYECAGTFSAVGRDLVKTIGIQYSQDTFVRLTPLPRLLDIDESMFLFHLNRSLAEKVSNIRIYANEYKLKEISRSGFSIEESKLKSEVSFLFSDEELADSWVTLRPPNESTFHIRFSEQTPKRIFHAEEVADAMRQSGI